MKKLLLLLSLLLSFNQSWSYDKLSVVERFTNCSCAPCASINNSWYNSTTDNLLNSQSITHIVYNVDWPSPTDPMHVLNAIDNNQRRGYYTVTSVPYISVNGTTISASQLALQNAVSSGNASYSPFKIEIYPTRYSNNVLNVKIVVTRDSSDNTSFNNTKLRVALTELTVDRTCLTCCNNGETLFHNVVRKMLPDGKGTLMQIPAPGESVEYEFSFIPSSQFLQEVDMTALSVVAFIQSDANRLVYQSAVEDVVFSNNINSAFQVEENVGAVPFELTFENFSTSTDSTSLTSYEWDFNNDGTIDSQEPNPTFTYLTEGSFSVKLTVSDGVNQHTRIIPDYVTALTNDADILVVNGIDYSNATYVPEMQQFYNSSACIGNNQVDVWDLFGDQGFNYTGNSSILKTHLFNRGIPTSVLNLYNKVIWIGNNFSGDLAFFDPAQVIEYVQSGRNFLLATRLGSTFFNTELRNYCGIQTFTGDQQVTDLVPLENGIITMPSTGTNNLVHLVSFNTNTEAIPVFDDLTTNNFYAGFRLNKRNEGTFVFIAGRPYRFNPTASFANYDYIINNWLISTPTGLENDGENIPESFALLQNYPNPFNPSTQITFSLPERSNVTLKIYDILGKEITILVNEPKSAGIYTVNFDASKLSSGVYIYSIQAGDFLESRKMLLMK